MTFPGDFLPSQYLIRREKETFGEWSLRNMNSLFLPYRDPNYSLESIIHLMMNRLHQNYEVIMQMEQTKRDRLFNIELELMKKEAQTQQSQF